MGAKDAVADGPGRHQFPDRLLFKMRFARASEEFPFPDKRNFNLYAVMLAHAAAVERPDKTFDHLMTGIVWEPREMLRDFASGWPDFPWKVAALA
jgi:hypothetical protein